MFRLPGAWNEPWHGDDLKFVFGWPILEEIGLPKEKEFSEQMIQIWSHFAEHGSASILHSDDFWFDFFPRSTVMKINGLDDSETANNWREAPLRFWKDYLIPKYLSKNK